MTSRAYWAQDAPQSKVGKRLVLADVDVDTLSTLAVTTNNAGVIGIGAPQTSSVLGAGRYINNCDISGNISNTAKKSIMNRVTGISEKGAN